MKSIQFKQTLLLLGGNATSALASKVVILDKIGKISDFIEKVINFGDILAEVRFFVFHIEASLI